MIYIKEKYFRRQIELLSFLSKGNDELVLWMYLESKYIHLDGLELINRTQINAESVTNYEIEQQVLCMERISVSNSIFNFSLNNVRKIKSNVDSICLYDEKSFEWKACAVWHEGMCLVRDASLLDELENGGFNASINKPEWW